jgi:hypothetical protein
VLGFFLIGPLIGLEITSNFFYEGNLLKDLQNPEAHAGLGKALLLVQGIGAFIGLIVFPIIHITAIEHKSLLPFFPSQRMILLILVLVAFLGLSFSISIAPLIEWNNAWEFPEPLKGFEQWAREKEDYAQKLTEIMTNSLSLPDLFVGLIVIAFIPAIGEELVFRGMLQNEIFRASRNIHTAIWTSAIIFSAIHFQLYGFIPRMLLGALFGYLYYWSGNLLLPIFAHFFNNAFGVIGIYLSNNDIVDINMEEDPSFPIQVVMINVIVTVGLLYYIRKHYREVPKPTTDY